MSAISSALKSRLTLHLVIALPGALLAWRWARVLQGEDPYLAGLTAEPIDATINTLGLWALRALLLTLAITPLRRHFRWNWLASWRRPLGLWCFAYALSHLTVYFALDNEGSLALLWQDVLKHRFVFFGMAALVLIAPLAATSTKGMIRRLGGRRWQVLHRLVYPAAILGAVHFIMRVKGFQWEPWLYAALLAFLLAARLKRPAYRD